MTIRAARLAELLEQVNHGQAKKALPSISRWLDKHPEHHALLNLKADALREVGRVDEAIEAFKTAAQAGAGAHNWQKAGQLLAETGRVDAALACLQDALKVLPESEETLNALISVHLDAQRFSEGIEFALRQAQISRDIHFLFKAALLLQRGGRSEEATRTFKAIVALSGQNAVAADIAPTPAVSIAGEQKTGAVKPPRPRYAIVTPYHQESRETLERCIRSVGQQTLPVEHILVADGHPQDWIDTAGVRHLRLDRAHHDHGHTPRAMGAMLASSEHYEGIGFLDAAHWLEPNHVASCIETYRSASKQHQVDYVIARRNLCRPNGSVLIAWRESVDEHVDPNCFFFFPPAYPMLQHFGLMPKALAAAADRFFYQALRKRGLQAAVNETISVNYLCSWKAPYMALGETPPPDAKPNIDAQAVLAWLESRNPDERQLAYRLIGNLP
jgi:tetratricopeptide (TPR) repeat protein